MATPSRFSPVPEPLSPITSGHSGYPFDSYYKEGHSQPERDVESVDLPYAEPLPVRTQSLHSTEEHNSSFLNVWWGISTILGFREKFSLLFFIIFGGALMGFCLARTMMMNPANVQNTTIPGEWFWYRQALYKPNIFIHIYATIIAAFFATFQFIPAIRRGKMILHRINGYLTLALLIPGTISGAIVGRRAFGGSPNTQSAYYVSAIMIVGAALTGILNVKNTRKHRKWMLRTVAYLAAPITTRIISLISREIISVIGSYYDVWTCAELAFLQSTGKGVPDFLQAYPQCGDTTVDPSTVHVAIQANTNAFPVNFGTSVRLTFGMGLWISLVIHVIGVEIYIRSTEVANQHRRGFVLDRKKGASDH